MKRALAAGMYSVMMMVFTLLIALTLSTGTAQAASVLNSCTTYCHGMPPVPYLY